MSLERYAILDGAGTVESVIMWDGLSAFELGADQTLSEVKPGWDVVNGRLAELPKESEPVPTPGPRYVTLATIRERVTAAGKWDEFAGAVDNLPAAKRWHLLTLQEGVATDDPDATALLTAIGCDPAAILAA